MHRSPNEFRGDLETDLLLPYVTDLEFEVDRLRKQSRFIEEQAWLVAKRVQTLCAATSADAESPSPVDQINSAIHDFTQVLIDLHQHPGYHPAHDQVTPIAVRPLVEQVFRWQQRLEGASTVTLRLELEIDYMDWFPARLRHIIDNLLANALKHGTVSRGEARIMLGLRRSNKGYELRIADNGSSDARESSSQALHLSHRAAPSRAPELGVGLAVVKSLIEQSGGTLTVQSDEGRGTSFLAVLPRYDLHDYLEKEPSLDSTEPAKQSDGGLSIHNV